jgi:hypothetical protein
MALAPDARSRPLGPGRSSPHGGVREKSRAFRTDSTASSCGCRRARAAHGEGCNLDPRSETTEWSYGGNRDSEITE